MDKKKAYLFCKFLHTEMKKIDEDKYFEGERQNNDPGQKFIIDWIKRNAKNFRMEYDNSMCKKCVHWSVCGYEVRQDCKDFELDNIIE